MCENIEAVRQEIPHEFLLVPPDGGDVKTHEGVANMRARVEALEAENARLREALSELLSLPIGHPVHAAYAAKEPTNE